MWAYIKDGAIKQVNAVQTRLEINPGSYFPAKYANEWTKEQKEAYPRDCGRRKLYQSRPPKAW